MILIDLRFVQTNDSFASQAAHRGGRRLVFSRFCCGSNGFLLYNVEFEGWEFAGKYCEYKMDFGGGGKRQNANPERRIK